MDQHTFKKVLRVDPEIPKLPKFGSKPAQMVHLPQMEDFLGNFNSIIFLYSLFFINTNKFKKVLRADTETLNCLLFVPIWA